MPAADFVVRQGDTASDLTDTLTDADGTPVSIYGATVTLTLTPIGGGTPIIDAVAADNLQTGPSTNIGKVRYQWREADTNTSADTATPGHYLATWKVTYDGGDVQSFPNDGYILVHITADAPETSGYEYATVAGVKATLEIGSSFADADVDRAIRAASRAIEDLCDRRFYTTGTIGSPLDRYYTPDRPGTLAIDDLQTLATVTLDTDGDGVFETTWTNGTDFVLEPLNAAADGRPYERVRVRAAADRTFPRVERSVKVRGVFGWAAVPDVVEQACTILAARLLKRSREAAFGIVSVNLDTAAAARIARDDPDVMRLLESVSRRPVLA